jgi:hypothetical protein
MNCWITTENWNKKRATHSQRAQSEKARREVFYCWRIDLDEPEATQHRRRNAIHALGAV